VSFLSQPLQNVLIRPKRMIGTIAVQVVVSEQTTDNLTITKQPVQQGAAITDHAYMEPTQFSHTIYFAAPGFTGGTSLSQIYQQLLTLQASAQPFDIVTPKRIYHSMLMTALSQTTDKLTENCLAIHATYQQIILVPILAATVPRANQKTPAKTSPTQNSGQKSVLLQAVGSPFSSFFGGG
jgi:Dit-like tail protein